MRPGSRDFKSCRAYAEGVHPFSINVRSVHHPGAFIFYPYCDLRDNPVPPIDQERYQA